jgi:hypothetical protein
MAHLNSYKKPACAAPGDARRIRSSAPCRLKAAFRSMVEHHFYCLPPWPWFTIQPEPEKKRRT